jgi:hypothetical protein
VSCDASSAEGTSVGISVGTSVIGASTACARGGDDGSGALGYSVGKSGDVPARDWMYWRTFTGVCWVIENRC